jgi:hypothetical protein
LGDYRPTDQAIKFKLKHYRFFTGLCPDSSPGFTQARLAICTANAAVRQFEIQRSLLVVIADLADDVCTVTTEKIQ